jgi:hypothetical protein
MYVPFLLKDLLLSFPLHSFYSSIYITNIIYPSFLRNRYAEDIKKEN